MKIQVSSIDPISFRHHWYSLQKHTMRVRDIDMLSLVVCIDKSVPAQMGEREIDREKNPQKLCAGRKLNGKSEE